MAHAKVMAGNKHFIILILLENITVNKLTPELQLYIRTFQYINIKNMDNFKKQLLKRMPPEPILNYAD